MPDVIVFAGPSACGIGRSRVSGLRWLPPVRRGDSDHLLERSRRAGVLVICDGIFGSEPAVSHSELCRAMDAGWSIWGVSSIGAIRAHELRFDGMRGFGYVYNQFERFPDFTDDEMCLIYVPDPPYFQVTEALVNLRYALERRKHIVGISDEAQLRVLVELRAMWFGDRTEDRIRQVMVQQGGIDAVTADALLAWTRAHRVKSIDLAKLLAERPWAASRHPVSASSMTAAVDMPAPVFSSSCSRGSGRPSRN